MSNLTAPLTCDGFKVAIICALPLEAENVQAVFDRCWDDEARRYNKTIGDQNEYTAGAIGQHNVVLVHMPSIGNNSASQVAANLHSTYPRIQLVLVVGICGVAPIHPETQEEIILGDIVISTAVTQYDFGRWYPEGFQRKTDVDDSLGRASPAIRALINRLRTRQNRQRLTSNLMQLIRSADYKDKVTSSAYPGIQHDWLYESSYVHQHRPLVECATCNSNRETCSKSCEELGCESERRIVRHQHMDGGENPDSSSDAVPRIHFGRFGSADTVLKSGVHRDKLSATDKLAAFEMEAAGVWEQYPTVIIKAACDYADSHKNKVWQPYAASMAAAALKVFLGEWMINDELKHKDEPGMLGLCLALAPVIQPNEFIGRLVEIGTIHNILQTIAPPLEQRRIVLGGIGGVGKTQLAIAYARKHKCSYTSVLWLDATSEQTLYASFGSVAKGLFSATDLDILDKERVLARAQEWLSHKQNQHWLLIFDNYDEPDSFDITRFYPNIGHGSIVVTSRLPNLVHGCEEVRVQTFSSLEESLDILQTRSGRINTKEDIYAHKLAERMAGLPLALVTAGAYLRKNNITFQQYLETYEQRWNVDRRRPLQIKEYQDRTLYTTWNLSYSRLKMDDPDAAQMLRLLAYFDHQALWYELFQIGLSSRIPSWLQSCLSNLVDFESVMSTLVEYCLVEVQQATKSYSIHSCVHDWSLGALNSEVDEQFYWYACDCVVGLMGDDDWDALGHIRYARTSRHVERLSHQRFEPCIVRAASWSKLRDERLHWMARMLKDQGQLAAAETISIRALSKYENEFGPDHPLTLSMTHSLGSLYVEQRKGEEAEKMLRRALSGYETGVAPDASIIFDVLNNLASVLLGQEKIEEAEQMYLRALAGKETTNGSDHISTLSTIHNLGHVYLRQNKLQESEAMYLRALAGYEKSPESNRIAVLDTLHDLGTLYIHQGKFTEAGQVLEYVLCAKEEALGPEHFSTVDTGCDLGGLYSSQQQFETADQMYRQTLGGWLNGPQADHPKILRAILEFGVFCAERGNLVEAEQHVTRAAEGMRRVVGFDHVLADHALEILHEIRLQMSRQTSPP